MTKLSIILPTYMEAESLPIVVPQIIEACRGMDFELIIADDNSPDGTLDQARLLSRKYPEVKPLLHEGERGLSPSVIFGFEKASGDILLCMDADGQHQPCDIPRLVHAFS